MLIAGACGDSGSESGEPVVDIVATGLLNPIGLALAPDGSVLVAEEGTGEGDTSAGLSVLEGKGTVRRLVSGLPSGRDSGDLSGAPLVGVDPDGSTVYIGHFGAGKLLTFPLVDGRVPFPGDPLGPDDLGEALLPLNEVRLINPFDITFDARGTPVVTDASGNGVATANADGTTRFIHRFGELTAPDQETLKIDAVPTGIDRVGGEYYVTLTGGCPYPEGAGALVAIDDARNQRTVVDGLNMPIDVAVADDGTVWVLEFARFDPDASCFTGQGYQPGTGRLSRLDGDRLETVLDGLDYPGAVLPMPDGSVYITEIFAGRVLRVTLEVADAAPEPKPGEAPRFTDVAATMGIDFEHGSFMRRISSDPAAMMGAGLCWIDYDGDGLLDLYLVNSHSLDEVDRWGDDLPSNALYRNTGSGFADVTEDTGTGLAIRGNGCLAADFDGNGRTDLYITADGPNALLMNDGVFTEVGNLAGVDATGWNSGAVAGDIDGDGLIDLFVGTYIDLERKIDNPSGAFPQDYVGIPDHLYLNQGDGTFRDIAEDAGLARAERALGALLTDADGDGDLDLYVANDGQPNRLYENVGEARFVDVTMEAGVGDSGSGMGIAGGDYDGDGVLDLLVTNWDRELNALYRSELGDTGVLTYQYSTFRIGLAGLGNGQTGWGTAWADFDHDTDLDLIIVNGRVPLVDLAVDAELVRLYRNLTADGEVGQFVDWTEAVGFEDLGPLNARGMAVADFDNDGDLDVAINTIGGTAHLLRNDGPVGNWLQVSTGQQAPGAMVTVLLPDGRRLLREIHAGSSYLASEDPRAHFGLGSFETVPRVEVIWPDGEVSVLTDIDANQLIEITR